MEVVQRLGSLPSAFYGAGSILLTLQSSGMMGNLSSKCHLPVTLPRTVGAGERAPEIGPEIFLLGVSWVGHFFKVHSVFSGGQEILSYCYGRLSNTPTMAIF